jgi:hypothetical protein
LQKKLNINENFICRIWEARDKYYSDLLTTENEKVEILNYGTRNFDSGPDYKGARIRIGEKIFTGDVEVHKDFQSWADHNHPKDRNYNTVILQVILWDSGKRVKPKLRIKRELPTVILSKFLHRSIHAIWQEIINNPSGKFKLPCQEFNHTITDELIRHTFDVLSIERLKLRTLRIRERLHELHRETGRSTAFDSFIRKSKGWEQVLYEYVFVALGYSKNKEPMLKLAKILPLNKISKFIVDSRENDIITIQSILYGCGGFLFDLRVKDEYTNRIKNIWAEIKDVLRAGQIDRAKWKFFRLRPQNFPTIRVAYGAQIILKLINDGLLKHIILSFQNENFQVNTCRKQLQELFAPGEDEYWLTHYDFGKKKKRESRLIGAERINDIITNVIIPLVYYYSIIFRNDILTHNVLYFYKNLRIHPVNSVLGVISDQVLQGRGIKINSPAMEQGAVQLYNFYCTRERCGECVIGANFVKEKGFEYKIIFY